MNYPAPVQRLLNEEAFRRYATTTSGSRDVQAELLALDEGTLLAASRELPEAENLGKSRAMARACISGLWLLHNFLDRSHDISQSLETPAGSHWHAIMHRLEGDFSNSKYWYRRVGEWELYEVISQRSEEPFDPLRFVDCVERQGIEATHAVAVAEWQVLFEHCFGGI